tara:strand:- start:523 stop:738 length:216 start_codon:yes stop_codon:yes gene_type:complete
MKDLKASINKINEVTDNINNFVNSNKKTINKPNVDEILIKENIELKNKNASIINKLEKILTKIKTLMEGEK